jgi:hypothetical protein
MRRSSTADLVLAISQQPKNPDRDALLARVMTDEFHDFHCPDDGPPCPKVELAGIFLKLGYHDLRKRLIDGEWDDSPCEPGTCDKCDELESQLRSMGLGK